MGYFLSVHVVAKQKSIFETNEKTLLSANSGDWEALYQKIFFFKFFSLFFVKGEWGGKDYTLENYSVLKNNFEENENRSNSLSIVLYFSSLECSALLQEYAIHIITWLSITFGGPTGTGAISWELKTWKGHFLYHTRLSSRTVMGHSSFTELL